MTQLDGHYVMWLMEMSWICWWRKILGFQSWNQGHVWVSIFGKSHFGTTAGW